MSEPSEPAPLPTRKALRAAEREAERQAEAAQQAQQSAVETTKTTEAEPLSGQSESAGHSESAGQPRQGVQSSSEQLAGQGQHFGSFPRGAAEAGPNPISRLIAGEGRKAPLTGAIPAVPAVRNRTVPAIPRPTTPLTELPQGAFAAAPESEPRLALPPRQVPSSEVSAAEADGAPPSRAGRNLPAAIGVGLVMLIVVLVGLLFYPPAFLAMVVLAAAFAVWELSRGLLQRGVQIPLVPMLVGVLAMPVAAYYAGPEGLLFALSACSLAIMLWRTLDPVPGAGQSIFAGVFVLAWVPFLISFTLLILRDPQQLINIFEFRNWTASDGALRVSSMLLLVVANDTFGYIFGALFGKHPMAPKISPKKSWEGFAGSVFGAAVIGVLAALFLLHQPWWVGVLLALGMVLAGTTGDLAESMVKRELGVKDMSSILPGHGGLMDRLDSILFAAPMAFLIFALFDLLGMG